MDAAVTCHRLTKRYGTTIALEALDLEVPRGALFGFLGPNGAGKTTTIRILAGLARPTSGTATVAGYDVVHGGVPLRRRVSHQDQESKLYGWMSGRELLRFVGRLFGLSGAELAARVDEMLDKTGLVEVASRRIAGYSGGMRQRLNLAQALLSRPEVLFLDEPASSLDPAGRHEVLELLAGLRGQITIFMSSHILEDVEKVCDRVAIIDHGRLLANASMSELQARFAEPIFVIELDPGQGALVGDITVALERAIVIRNVRREAGTFRVLVSDPAQGGREILRILATAGVSVSRFERQRPSLEDVFLRLIDAQSQRTTAR